MDYAICEAAKYTSRQDDRLLPVLLIYDVACQWRINFQERLKMNSKTLSFPEFQRLMVAVGKFHLGAHIKSCFWEHSLNFVKGAGQQDGEIMETLWALFNKFAKMGRAMTAAHRWEILNDHMRDVNWKKLVGMGLSSFL